MLNCNLCTPFEEILEIQGKDVATVVNDDNNIGYIRCPLFKCPKEDCCFTARKSVRLLEYIRSSHMEDYNTVINLSPTCNILWLMQANNKGLTIYNMVHIGKVQQCAKCGWCTTNTMAAASHVSVQHREEKKTKYIHNERDIHQLFFLRQRWNITITIHWLIKRK